MEGDISAVMEGITGDLMESYPWFDIPLLAAVRPDRPLERRLALLAIWRSRLCVSVPVTGTAVSAPELTKAAEPVPPGNDTMSLIEEFMHAGEHRITPRDDTPDGSLASSEGGLPPDELLTEELASIYLVQGLTREAVEIYRRLSLLYPEKSVYFAEIIDRAQAAEAADSDRIK